MRVAFPISTSFVLPVNGTLGHSSLTAGTLPRVPRAASVLRRDEAVRIGNKPDRTFGIADAVGLAGMLEVVRVDAGSTRIPNHEVLHAGGIEICLPMQSEIGSILRRTERTAFWQSSIIPGRRAASETISSTNMHNDIVGLSI